MRRCTLSLVGCSRPRLADETKSCGCHTRNHLEHIKWYGRDNGPTAADATEKWNEMRKISPTTNLSHWLFALYSPSFVLFNVPQGCHINFADSLGIEINVPCVYFASLFNSSFWLCSVLALYRILCATHWISRMRLWFDSSKMRGQICYDLVGNSSHAHKSSPHTCTPATCEDTARG